MNHTFLFFTILLVGLFSIQRYKPANTEAAQYIQQYKNLAKQNEYQYNIPTCITLAQAILESRSGKGALAQPIGQRNQGKHEHCQVLGANNHFCIKGTTPTGYSLCCDDKCFERFRAYPSVEASYQDYGAYLAKSKIYKPCFEECSITDYKCWARALQRAGYATDPNYAEKLIKIVEENNLNNSNSIK